MEIEQLLDHYIGRDSDININSSAFHDMSSIFTHHSSMIVESATVTPIREKHQPNPETRALRRDIEMIPKTTPVKSL